MIETEIWYYVNSETRTVRFSRKAVFSGVPFIGAMLEIPGDNLEVTAVSFKDGGGITIVAGEDPIETLWKDSNLDDEIEEMTSERGWIMLSNVKRRS
ncbi:MAG: hypothetical protein M0P16_00675 [Syntrophales bacterium]|jgi:hypothetical protein|nr:hypothetical protein [Syntrophales bacterium]MCK9390301.1 hypothetical protein [Syntrophales bacterium]